MNSLQNTKDLSRHNNFGGILSNLTVPTTNQARVIWVAVLGIIVIIAVGLLIRHSHFDLTIVQFFNGYHQGTVGTLTNDVYKFFGPLFAILGTVVLTGIIIALTRSLRIGSTFAVTIAATWVSLAVVKLAVHRLRPDPSQLTFPFNPAQIDPSYPSGHAAFITALVVTIFLGVAINKRWLVGLCGGLAIIVVATSLLVDGIHFPSDIIASIVWAIVVAPLVRMAWVSLILKRVDSVISRRTQRTHLT